MKLHELAERLGCRLEGDGSIDIRRVAGLEQAGPGDVSFLANPRYAAALHRTRASAVIVAEGVGGVPCAALRCRQPYLAFANAVSLFAPVVRPEPGVHHLACLAAGVELGEDVAIGPFASIGAGARIGRGTAIFPHVTIGDGVSIGEDSVIHARVSIRERVVIGSRVVIQDGAVIGSDGFGYVRLPDGSHQKIPQASLVVIEDDVGIGANTTIDRPAVGETRVRQGAKIDNLVQVAHGVAVGRNTMLCAQVGIAGSTAIGDNVILAGQVGVAGHIRVGDGTVANAKTGISRSTDAGAQVAGYPAFETGQWRKSMVIVRNLPELRQRVLDLEARIEELERRLAARTGPSEPGSGG